jgi:CRISPR-associated protein Csm5
MGLVYLWGWIMSKVETDKLVQIPFALRVVTPVSIGDGTELNPREYLYNPKDNSVIFLHELEWHKFLNRKRALPQYERYLQTPAKYGKSLYEWASETLGAHSLVEAQLGPAIRSQTKAVVKDYRNNQKKTLNSLRPCLRLVDGRVYIPGSSIKGVMRTAILYHLLRKNDRLRQEFRRNLERSVFDNKDDGRGMVKELKRLLSDMETQLLHRLDFSSIPNTRIRTSDAKVSSMRGLLCSDAISEGPVVTQVLQKVDLTLKSDKPTSYLPIFRESILRDNVFHFTVTLDKPMLDTIGITSGQQLVDILTEYTEALNRMLLGKFKRLHASAFASISDANAYMGSNTGFLHKTLIAALYDTPDEVTQIVKTILSANKAFRKHKHYQDRDFSPRTIKATMVNGVLALTGGVQISIEDK